MSSQTGGNLIAQMLRAEGVEVVFGIIDGSYVGLNVALHEYGIRLVTPRHETSAAHMAGAYARLTGKLGVCIASNGPGAANILPGVAVENGEGNRVLVITSWRRSGIVNPDRGGTYQYFDQVSTIKPMSKWSGWADSFERLPEIFRRAFRTSYEGRPGVVHVSVPEDVMNAPMALDVNVLSPDQYRCVEPQKPSSQQVRQAADVLEAAQLPMIHAGSGVIHALASDELLSVAQSLGAPVTTSWGGRASIDERSDVSVSMAHQEMIQKIRCESDVVLALGTRFGETDWWGKPPYWANPKDQRLIQVDIDAENIGMNKPVNLAVQADIKTFLLALRDELRRRGIDRSVSSHAERIRGYKQEQQENGDAALAIMDAMDVDLPSYQIPITCQEVFVDDAVTVIDGGNTAVWANSFHQVRTPGAHLMTYKFGMLGAGIGYALGAKVAYPDRQVCCILGDGAMGFHMQEVETAVRNQLAIVFVVLADRQWGMVKFSQGMTTNPEGMMERKSLSGNETINTDLAEIKFDKLAEAMGGHGEHVSSLDELKPALERAIASNTCAVVHVDVDPVSHLWAPGLDTFKAMHLEPAG